MDELNDRAPLEYSLAWRRGRAHQHRETVVRVTFRLDHLGDDVVTAAWFERIARIADEPGSHADLRGLATERLEQAFALLAAIAGHLYMTAIRTQGRTGLRECGCRTR